MENQNAMLEESKKQTKLLKDIYRNVQFFFYVAFTGLLLGIVLNLLGS